jgi:hypothetical protein
VILLLLFLIYLFPAASYGSHYKIAFVSAAVALLALSKDLLKYEAFLVALTLILSIMRELSYWSFQNICFIILTVYCAFSLFNYGKRPLSKAVQISVPVFSLIEILMLIINNRSFGIFFAVFHPSYIITAVLTLPFVYLCIRFIANTSGILKKNRNKTGDYFELLKKCRKDLINNLIFIVFFVLLQLIMSLAGKPSYLFAAAVIIAVYCLMTGYFTRMPKGLRQTDKSKFTDFILSTAGRMNAASDRISEKAKSLTGRIFGSKPVCSVSDEFGLSDFWRKEHELFSSK